MWWRRNGETWRGAAAHYERTGRWRPILDEAPSIPEHLANVWQDFQRLSRYRAQGMGGPGPIPFETLDRYATRQRIFADFDRWLSLIEAMDEAWLAEVRRQQEQSKS